RPSDRSPGSADGDRETAATGSVARGRVCRRLAKDTLSTHSPSSAARRIRRLAHAGYERQDQLLKPARPWSPAEDQPPAYRRWPSGNPRLSAFCRSAPAVRFMALEICFTGDFLRECAFKSRTSALDQARRLTRLARLLAICPSSAAAAAMRPSIAERMRDEKQSGSAAASSVCAWPYFAAICTRSAIAP